MGKLFDSAIRENVASRLKGKKEQQKEETGLSSALRRAPAAIARLRAVDEQFDAYMKTAKRVALPNEDTGFDLKAILAGKSKFKRTGLVLASFEFSETGYNRFRRSKTDIEVDAALMLVTQGEKQSLDMFVLRSKQGSGGLCVWCDADEYLEKKKVRKVIKDLADPKTTIATLFKFRAPRKNGHNGKG